MAVKKVTSKSDLDAHINNMDVKATIVCVLHPRDENAQEIRERLERAATDFPSFCFAEVNHETQMDLVRILNSTYSPAFLVYKKGVKVDSLEGWSKSHFTNLIDEHNSANANSRMVYLLTDTEYDAFVAKSSTAIVFFSDKWATACRSAQPIFEELSAQNASLAFGLAHYDVLNEKARGLDIAGLPHFIVYRSGSKIDEFSGWSEKWLRNAVNKHSSSASSSSSEASNGQVTHVASKREFDAFISKDVTIVDLYAKWCGPCQIIKPLFAQLAGQYVNINFVTVDVEESEEGVADGVKQLPTFRVYKSGQKIDEWTGGQGDLLKSKLAKYAH